MAPVLFITQRALFSKNVEFQNKDRTSNFILQLRSFSTFLAAHSLERFANESTCYSLAQILAQEEDSLLDRRRSSNIFHSWIVGVGRIEGFILRRFTMLYGVGLAASTNNCQLNVPRIDRPGCLLAKLRISFLSARLEASCSPYFYLRVYIIRVISRRKRDFHPLWSHFIAILTVLLLGNRLRFLTHDRVLICVSLSTTRFIS